MKIPIVRKNAGETLRQLRLDKGLTQVNLSSKMGLSNSQHLWNIEHAKNSLTLEMADKAAKALDVKLEVFLSAKVK